MGNKAMKRKFGKKVINGSMTQADAWNRLERAEQEKRARRAGQVSKSAGGTRPSPAAVYGPGREAEFMQSAFAPMTFPQQPTTIQKARQRAADRQSEQALARVRESVAKAYGSVTTTPTPTSAPRPLVKQLTQPGRAVVAELRRELACVAHDPVRREEVSARILQITGDPFTPGVM